MKTNPLIIVVLRLAALYLLYQSLLTLLGIIQFYCSETNMEIKANAWFLVAQCVFPFIGFLFLWLFPATISKHVMASHESKQTDENMNWLDGMRLLVIAIGLFFFTVAIIDGTYWLTTWSLLNDHDTVSLLAKDKANMLATAIEFVVGLTLIAKNTWISRWLMTINAPEKSNRSGTSDQTD